MRDPADENARRGVGFRRARGPKFEASCFFRNGYVRWSGESVRQVVGDTDDVVLLQMSRLRLSAKRLECTGSAPDTVDPVPPRSFDAHRPRRIEIGDRVGRLIHPEVREDVWSVRDHAAPRRDSQLASVTDARDADVTDVSSNQSGQPALRFAALASARSADVAWLISQLRSRGQRMSRYQSGGTSAARKHRNAFGIRGPSASGFIL